MTTDRHVGSTSRVGRSVFAVPAFVLLALAFPLMLAAQENRKEPAEKSCSAYLSSSVDIFDACNKAANDVAHAGMGSVRIPSGNYENVRTKLLCRNGIMFLAAGVKIAHTGSAFQCANSFGSGIVGPIQLIGPGSETASVGVQLGIGSDGTNTVTEHNTIEMVEVSGFGKGFWGEGYGSNNGTYSNTVAMFDSHDNGYDFYLRPSGGAGYFNANNFITATARAAVSDCWLIDGAAGNFFLGARGELCGGYGVNFPGSRLTQGNQFFGGWFESNHPGDVHIGSAENVQSTALYGTVLLTNGNVNGTKSGLRNHFEPGLGALQSDSFASPYYWHITSNCGTQFCFAFSNDEKPRSGLLNIFGISRTAANKGTLFVGTPEFPVVIRSDVTIPSAKAKQGKRFVCIDTDGKLVSSATPCAGS